MATAAQLHDARARGDHRRQYVQPGGRHVTVNEVLRIVEIAASQSHPGVRRSANLLIRYMAEADWRIAAGLHRGGRPDNPRPDTLSVRMSGPEAGEDADDQCQHPAADQGDARQRRGVEIFALPDNGLPYRTEPPKDLAGISDRQR
jgi:hypothetical protein